MSRIIMLLILCVVNVNSYAGAQTNINEVTDLFDRNIENKESLFKEMKGQNENAIGLIGSKQATQMTPGMERAESEISGLNSIKDTDLDNAGRSKRSSEEFRFYDENELEPDYTKPGNKLHKLDADEIADATARLVGDLMQKLKDLNIDCKTVKGPVAKEPIYFIDIKRENRTNTEYDQFFCEEPRNKYNCNDVLTIKCTKRGTSELKHIAVPFDAIPSHWRVNISNSSIYRSAIYEFRPSNTNEIKSIITSRIGRSDIEVPTQAISLAFIVAIYWIKQNSVEHTYHQHIDTDGMQDGKIKVRLHYYTGNEGECLEWQEDWTERCILQ